MYFRLTPKSSKNAIDGIVDTADGPALQARVTAPPEDGAANTALAKLVATSLGVPKTAVSLATGARSRLKSLRIVGDAQALTARLESLLAPPAKKEKRRTT